MCVGNGFARAAFVAVLAILSGGMVSADQVVIIPDPTLELIFRIRLDKPTGDIMDTDLAQITHLVTDATATPGGVDDLTGLEYCVNLEVLSLDIHSSAYLEPLRHLGHLETVYVPMAGNETDFAALAMLTGLRTLYVGNDTPSPATLSDLSSIAVLTDLESLAVTGTLLSDLTPITAMVNLRKLILSHNAITDISPLAALSNLEWLDIGNAYRQSRPGNRIADLSPLSGLTSLKTLVASELSLTDLSSATSLPSVETLDLSGNLIRDVTALVANPEFDEGDYIDLRLNPLSEPALCTGIPALGARGVSVAVTGGCGQAPTILQQPSGGWVEVGAQHVFTVLADSSGSYEWYKDGQFLWPRTPESEFVIPSVSEEDSGVYVCVVSTADGVVMTQPARLNVVPENSLPGTSLAGLAAACMACAALAARKLARRG